MAWSGERWLSPLPQPKKIDPYAYTV